MKNIESVFLSKVLFRLVFLTILIAFFYQYSFDFVEAQPMEDQKQIYLPLILRDYFNGFRTDNKFLGITMARYWTNDTVQTYMTQADNLSGKKHSVTGWFIGLQDLAFTGQSTDIQGNSFYQQLEALWQKGYISFINFGVGSDQAAWTSGENCPIPSNAFMVAKGDCDRAIQKMADLYYQWISQGNGRRAFLAPFPEMNGVDGNGVPWTSYGGDPETFKLAYQRIQYIFAQKGISRSQAWWVFAPNGWHDPAQPQHAFENYYPGDLIVDVVAFSSYNFGFCWVGGQWKSWNNYDTLFQPYFLRMQQMAPHKPIVIAQTGSTSEYNATGVFLNEKKNEWLLTNYTWLANQPSLLGVLYFDINGACKWGITSNGYDFSPGYREGSKSFSYLSTQDIQAIIGD